MLFRQDRMFEAVLEKKIPSGTLTNEGPFKTLRNNIRARRLASDTSYELYQQAREDGTAVDEHGDIMTFMEWLMKNFDTILPIIQKIIALFGT